MNYFYYYDLLIVVLAVSIVLNILFIGLLVRWMRYAESWKNKYQDATAPVVPVDPYEALHDSGYPWEGEWD